MIYYSVIEQRRDEAIPNIFDDPQTVVLSYESKAIIKDGKSMRRGHPYSVYLRFSCPAMGNLLNFLLWRGGGGPEAHRWKES